MIRFVDLSQAYWTDPPSGKPICAFLSTVTDQFIANDCGQHTYSSMEEIDYAEFNDKARLRNHVPDGFFENPVPNLE